MRYLPLRDKTSSSSALTVVVTITATQGYLPDGTGTCSNNVCTIDRNVAIPANMTSQTHNETTKAVSSAQEGIITATIKVDQNYVFGASKQITHQREYSVQVNCELHQLKKLRMVTAL